MEIFANGNKVDFTLENEKMFGEVYKGLKKWVENGSKKIWGIKINNASYDIEDEKTFNNMDINEIKIVDLNIGEIDAGKEMMARVTSLREGFKEVEKLLDTVVKDFHTGNEVKIKETWPKVLYILTSFNESFPYLAALHGKENEEEITGQFGKYRDVLQEIVKCIEMEDNVSFCDQLEYELQPRIEEWTQFLLDTRNILKQGK